MSLQKGNARELRGFAFPDVLFFRFDGDVLTLDIEAQPVVDAHVDICDPDERKERQQVTAPIAIKKLEVGDGQEDDRYIVAETILAGKKEEEFAGIQASSVFAHALAILARLAENFFVGNGPGDTGGGDREDEQPRELHANGH